MAHPPFFGTLLGAKRLFDQSSWSLAVFLSDIPSDHGWRKSILTQSETIFAIKGYYEIGKLV